MATPDLQLVAVRAIDRVTAALEARGLVVRAAGRPQYRCPAHEDRHPSLSVSEAEDGRALLKCQAGCPTERVVAALGLAMRDLFAHVDARARVDIPATRTGRPTKRFTDDYFSKCAPPYPAIYRDADGATPLLLVARWDVPEKRYAQYRPDGAGGWLKGLLPDTKRPLYQLAEVHAAIQAGETVTVHEGEKAVHAAMSIGLTATTNPGGAGRILPEHVEVLRQAQRLALFPDNDPSGAKHMETFAAMLVAAGAPDVRIVNLPGLPKKGDIHDWLKNSPEREKAAALIQRLIESTPRWEPKDAPPVHAAIEADARPIIRLTTETHEVVAQAIQALAEAGDLYSRGGQLVRIIRNDTPPRRRMHVPDGTPSIKAVSPEWLQVRLAEVARWERYGTGEWVRASAPIQIAKAVLAQGEWPVPALEMVSDSPYSTIAGEVITSAGYDDTGIFLTRDHPSIEVVPDYLARAVDASMRLNLAFRTFRYADAGVDWPATLAALLTCIGRPMIHGPVPGFGFTSPVPQSGKGMLARTIAAIALGREPVEMPGDMNRDEWRKTLVMIASKGYPIVSFDNLEGIVRSGSLASVLTSRQPMARLLGKGDEDAGGSWWTVIFLTGVNLRYGGDIAYRVIPITLDPKVERPDALHFDFDPVENAMANRPALLASALEILREHGPRWMAHEKRLRPLSNRLGRRHERRAKTCGTGNRTGHGEQIGLALPT